MHVTKFSQGACGHMINHYEREEGDGVTRSNEEIVPELTHLNYNLAAEDQPKAGYQYLSERLEVVHHINRSDIIVMADWVITAPEEIKKDQEKCRQFFECSYDFMKQKYSKASIISAWVHMDETTPHLHFAFMPIVKDEKHGGMKLGAKQLINRVELKKIHNQLQKKIDKELPFECKVLNGATKLGNRSVEELKEVTKKTETIVTQAEENASNTIVDAKEQAKAIVETANREAEHTVLKAESVAEEKIAVAAKAVGQLEKKAKNILTAAENESTVIIERATKKAEETASIAQEQSVAIITTAKQKAKSIHAEAEANASNTISVALSKAENIETKARNKANTVLTEADSKAKEIRHQANEYEKDSRLKAKNRAEGILQRAEASANNIMADATIEADSIIDNAENEATEIIAKAKKESTFWERAYHELADWVDKHFEKVLSLVLGKWWNWDKEEISEAIHDLKEAWDMNDEDLEQIILENEEVDDDLDRW